MNSESSPSPRTDWEPEYLRAQLNPGYVGRVTNRIDASGLKIDGRDVLDIGCGPGVFVEHFLARGARRVVGLDVSAFYLSRLRQREPRAECVVASAHTLPFADESFDAVLLLDTLLHLDARKALAEARRVLRPEGILWVSHKLAGYYWWKIRYRMGRSPKQYVVETLSSIKRLLEPRLGLSRRSTYVRSGEFATMLDGFQIEMQKTLRYNGIPNQIEVLARKTS